MNIFEMHIGVNLGVQKIGSNFNGDLLDEEIDYYLNNSINDFIKEQYSLLKTKDRNPQSQYVNENLRQLITTVKIENITGYDLYPNAVEATFPNNYNYYINSLSTYTGNQTRVHRRLENKGLENYIKTQFNDPIFRELPVLIEGNKLIVIGDFFTDFENLSSITLTYIKKHPSVKLMRDGSGLYDSINSIQPDLPDHTHKMIVDMTVQTILKDLTQFKGE